jgi:hypothetical protein
VGRPCVGVRRGSGHAYGPRGGATSMASLQQMARFNPTSLATSFSTMQGGRLWESTMTGAGAGGVLDAGQTGIENAMAALNFTEQR